MANSQPVSEVVTPPSPAETMVEGTNNVIVDEEKPVDVTAADRTELDGHAEQQQEGESQLARLHRLCAEGDVMGVRGILSQSLELLESIDLTTGWTPMLQAIYGGQVEVVRELLLAGAYPPPPSVTSDPAILSLLYPPQPYGIPGNAYQGPAPINGMHQPRMSVSAADGQPRHGAHEAHKLPPIEVSRTIPCRNFPNCRYGDACIFQHPVPIPGAIPAGQAAAGGPAFYPSPYPTEFVPGFAAPYLPGGFPQGAPAHQMYYSQYPPAPHMGAPSPFVPLDGSAPQAGQPRGPSPHSAPFVPFIPASGSPGAGDRASPLANNLVLDGSLAPEATNAVPEGETTGEAAAPSTDAAGSVPVITGPGVPQFAPRHSVPGGFPGHLPFYANGNANTNAGFEPRRNAHMKKMSFNAAKHGGVVNARAAVLGTWTNGQPPPCVFFQNSKCRNGEMCKFPHIAADGTDCRHPDVINGTLAPAPISLSNNTFRGPRGRGASSVNAGHFERHQHVQAMKAHGAAAARNNAAANNRVEGGAAAAPATELSATTEKDAQESSKPVDETSSNETKVEEAFPDIPTATTTTQQPKSTATRSVPNTRAGSPNHAYGSFRNGRAGRGPHQNGRDNSRSTSIPAGQREIKQKLPSADDFPALSGSTSSLTSDSVVLVKPVAAFNGKTAAQVLSAPAPVKPAAPVKAEAETKVDEHDKEFERVSSSPSSNDVTTESDEEAVIISHTPTPAPRPESKPAPLSFAAAAAAVASSEPAVLVASTA